MIIVKLRDNNVFASRSRILTLDQNDPESVRLTIRDLTEQPMSSTETY